MKQMENEMIVSVPLEVVKASEIEPREVKWLWYPYIPFGKVTLLQGDPVFIAQYNYQKLQSEMENIASPKWRKLQRIF